MSENIKVLENDLKEMLIDAEEKLLKTHMIAKFMMDIAVPDEEVQKFYDENPNQFIAPDSIRASHILLPNEEQAVTVIDEIKKVLIKFQGERHLFVDGKEINPYDRGGGMG